MIINPQFSRRECADGTFLREPFMQHVHSSVHMVLALPVADISLDSLSNMDDRIPEVDAPSVAADHVTPTRSADAG